MSPHEPSARLLQSVRAIDQFRIPKQLAFLSQIRPVRLSVTVPSPLSVKQGKTGLCSSKRASQRLAALGYSVVHLQCVRARESSSFISNSARDTSDRSSTSASAVAASTVAGFGRRPIPILLQA